MGKIILPPLLWLLTLFSRLLGMIFGQLTWTPPQWARHSGNFVDPVVRWVSSHKPMLVLLVIMAGGIWWGQPMLKKVFHGVVADSAEVKQASVRVIPPARTEIENNGSPKPVALEFSTASAPLAKIGKDAPEITLTPAFPGKWVWASDTRLEFVPGEDWPVGQHYTIKLGKKALAPHVGVETREYEFLSPTFNISVSDAQFYQYPVQVSLRKAVYEVKFSHPVQPGELEKRVQLNYGEAGKTLLDFGKSNVKFTVVYDKFKINATIHSEALAIPNETSTMVLRIAPGVTAQRGGEGSQEEVVKAVEVPGLNSLAIEKIDGSVVTGDDGEPQHLLNIQTGMMVNEREMSRVVSAWALPARAEKAGEDGEGGWSDPAEVTDAVLRRAHKLVLTAVPQERETNETHMFRFKADPGSYLLIRVDKGLKSIGGYQLGEKRDAIVQVKAFAPELAIMSKGSLLALSGEKKLPILVRDLPGMHVEIARLLPHQLHMLATQSDGAFTQPQFYRGITPDNLTERFEKDVPLTHLRAGKTHYETIDFSQYLKTGSGERHGAFLLSVRGYEPKKAGGNGDDSAWGSRSNEYGEEGGYYQGEPSEEQRQFDPFSMKDTRLVLVTDLGFLIKKAADGSSDVFVQSIASSAPVADATVEVWGRNGLVLIAQKTDTSGQAHLTNLNAYTREKLPVLVVVKKGDDLSFMPLHRGDRGLDLSRFDIGGVHGAGLPNQTRAYLFSDRGIYRPGDTMHIGMVVKSGDWAQSAKDLPVEAEIIDARGLVAKREKLKVGPGGMAEISYATFDSSPTGNYTINLNLARDTGQTMLAPSSNVRFLPSRNVRW